MELFSIRWADVESYCRSTEEMRFKLLQVNGNKSEKNFQISLF